MPRKRGSLSNHDFWIRLRRPEQFWNYCSMVEGGSDHNVSYWSAAFHCLSSVGGGGVYILYDGKPGNIRIKVGVIEWWEIVCQEYEQRYKTIWRPKRRGCLGLIIVRSLFQLKVGSPIIWTVCLYFTRSSASRINFPSVIVNFYLTYPSYFSKSFVLDNGSRSFSSRRAVCTNNCWSADSVVCIQISLRLDSLVLFYIHDTLAFSCMLNLKL